MDELIQKMQVVLADTTELYQQAHKYHWNVIGSDFFMYHKLFEQIYEELYAAIDSIGEHLKALDGYAPYGSRELGRLTTLLESQPASADQMILDLYNNNARTMSTLMQAYKTAEKFSEIGLSNFVQDRYDHHKKIQYFLRSTMKGGSE